MSSPKVSRTNVREFFPPNDNKTKDKEMNRIKSDVSYWNALYFVVVLASSILITSILTLIPRHNSVLYPIYWYEVAIMYIFEFIDKCAGSVVVIGVFCILLQI